MDSYIPTINWLDYPDLSTKMTAARLIADNQGIVDFFTTALASEGKGFAPHGSNPNFSRPTGWQSVEWFGSVEPVNAIDGDTWIDTSGTGGGGSGDPDAALTTVDNLFSVAQTGVPSENDQQFILQGQIPKFGRVEFYGHSLNSLGVNTPDRAVAPRVAALLGAELRDETFPTQVQAAANAGSTFLDGGWAYQFRRCLNPGARQSTGTALGTKTYVWEAARDLVIFNTGYNDYGLTGQDTTVATSNYTGGGTLTVASNVGFDSAGIIAVQDNTGASQYINYTGKSGTTQFTGVTGFSGTADIGNPVTQFSATNGAADRFKNGLLAGISRARAAAVFDNDNAESTLTKSGGTDVTAGAWPVVHGTGTTIYRVDNTGDYVEIAVPADFPGGQICIAFLSDPTQSGGTWTISNGATGTVVCENMSPELIGSDWEWGVSVFRTPVMTSGSKTIRATWTQGTGPYGYFDSWWAEAQRPPMVAVCNQPYSTSPPHSELDILNTAIDQVIAAFGDANTVFKVDVNSALTYSAVPKNSDMADGVHWNARGHRKAANEMVKTIIGKVRTLDYHAEGNALGSGLVSMPGRSPQGVIQGRDGDTTPLTIRRTEKDDQRADLMRFEIYDKTQLARFDRYSFLTLPNTLAKYPTTNLIGSHNFSGAAFTSGTGIVYVATTSGFETKSGATDWGGWLTIAGVKEGIRYTGAQDVTTTVTADYTWPGSGTLQVASATALPTSGAVRIGSQTITYTGKSSTTLTGVSGGSGTTLTGATVTQGKFTGCSTYGTETIASEAVVSQPGGLKFNGYGSSIYEGLFGTFWIQSGTININADKTAFGSNVELTAGNNLTIDDGAFSLIRTSGLGVIPFTMKTPSDTYLRFGVDPTGGHWWGDGTVITGDITLGRSAANELALGSGDHLRSDDPTAAQHVSTKAYADNINTYFRVIKDFGMNAFVADAAAGEYFIGLPGAPGTPGVLWALASASHNLPPIQVSVSPTDYPTVSGKTLRLRLRVWANTNATPPNLNLTFSLKLLSVGGAADTMTYSFGGTPLCTATIANASLTASTAARGTGTPVDFPTGGLYAVTVTSDAALANNAYLTVGAKLEAHYE